MSAKPLARLAAGLLLAGAVRAANGQGVPLEIRDLQAGDRFGATLAIGKDVIAVGAYLSDAGGRDSGAVYVYRRQQGSWKLQRVVPGGPGDQLGFDLAIDNAGTTLLAGAPFAEVGGIRCGAVLRFTLTEGQVQEEPRIVPPGQDCELGSEFGSAVAIEPPIVGVGARGARRRMGRVYATFNGGALASLEAPEIQEGDELGTSLATDGSRLVAGAPFTDRNGTDSGSVYVFSRSGPLEIRRPQSGQALAAFGYSVAVRGSLLVVGAPLEDRGGTDSGAVHRFEGSTETVSTGVKAGDQLGVSVTLGDGSAFAGARRAGGDKSGAVYRVTRDGALGRPILSPRPQNGAEFGFAVATRDQLLAVGAFLEDAPGAPDAGAAYVFEQTVSVEFASAASTVTEPDSVDATVDLDVILRTSDGLPTVAPVRVDLPACPVSGVCTADAGDFAVASPQTLAAGTSPGRVALKMTIKPDPQVEGPEVFVVQLSPVAPARAEGQVEHTVTILDSSHGPDLVISPSSLVAREGGPPVVLGVRLASRPTSTVTVTLTSTDASEGTVSSPPLVFMPAKWDQVQNAALKPIDDPLCDGDQTYAVTAQARSADPDYAGRQRSVGARTEDNEVACLSAVQSVCADADNTVVYTIEITNAGPQPVAAHLEDPLPSAVSIVTASADSGVATVDYLENSVVWNGLVPVGGRAVITIVAGLDALPPGTEVSNLATLSWVRDDQGTVATLATPAVFRAGDVGCPPLAPP